jgi:hypothetical protein
MLVALRRSSRESGRARLEESGRAVTPATNLAAFVDVHRRALRETTTHRAHD